MWRTICWSAVPPPVSEEERHRDLTNSPSLSWAAVPLHWVRQQSDKLASFFPPPVTFWTPLWKTNCSLKEKGDGAWKWKLEHVQFKPWDSILEAAPNFSKINHILFFKYCFFAINKPAKGSTLFTFTDLYLSCEKSSSTSCKTHSYQINK